MDVLHVQAARIPDRDRVLKLLEEHGHDAHAVGEVRIDVVVGGDSQTSATEVLHDVEEAVMDIGDSFVPVKHQGVIYLRPPIG